jgi:alginate O-acetyltransferase complex protein AlgI
MIGWVFFRSADASAAIDYLAVMTTLAPYPAVAPTIPIILSPDKITFLIIATVCAIFPVERIRQIGMTENLKIGIQGSSAMILMAFSCMMISANGFNPFIYFRF